MKGRVPAPADSGRERVVLPRTCLCDTLCRRIVRYRAGGPTTVEDGRRRHAAPDSSSLLSEGVLQLSRSATRALNDDVTSPPAINTYSHQRLLGLRKRLGEPQVQLESTDAHSAFASTDCSGWLSFVLNTVSPLHEAVLQSQRRLDAHNRVYSEDFALRESRRPWSRAFVVTQYLRSDHVEGDRLRPGDELRGLAAWRHRCLRDGTIRQAVRREPSQAERHGTRLRRGGLAHRRRSHHQGLRRSRNACTNEAAKVIAVPVVDSSATIHFDPDSRKSEEGATSLPNRRPHVRARAGGVGTGTVWFALSEEGRVLQRRIGPQQKYRPVLARAARLRGRIYLDEAVLDGGSALLVRVFDTLRLSSMVSPTGMRRSISPDPAVFDSPADGSS